MLKGHLEFGGHIFCFGVVSFAGRGPKVTKNPLEKRAVFASFPLSRTESLEAVQKVHFLNDLRGKVAEVAVFDIYVCSEHFSLNMLNVPF